MSHLIHGTNPEWDARAAQYQPQFYNVATKPVSLDLPTEKRVMILDENSLIVDGCIGIRTFPETVREQKVSHWKKERNLEIGVSLLAATAAIGFSSFKNRSIFLTTLVTLSIFVLIGTFYRLCQSLEQIDLWSANIGELVAKKRSLAIANGFPSVFSSQLKGELLEIEKQRLYERYLRTFCETLLLRETDPTWAKDFLKDNPLNREWIRYGNITQLDDALRDFEQLRPYLEGFDYFRAKLQSILDQDLRLLETERFKSLSKLLEMKNHNNVPAYQEVFPIAKENILTRIQLRAELAQKNFEEAANRIQEALKAALLLDHARVILERVDKVFKEHVPYRRIDFNLPFNLPSSFITPPSNSPEQPLPDSWKEDHRAAYREYLQNNS